MLNRRFHDSIYAIYGFVRYADEIVDTFHDKDKELLLDRFEKDTFQAIEENISLNPVLHAFQLVVNQYNIEHKLIKAFLYSMRMDLTKTSFTQEEYEKYIYGSAEVVGLMCLWVFCNGNSDRYNALESPARKLGAAFQKVNFLRDMKSDYDERGRVYFPGVNYLSFTQEDKLEIERDIENDFNDAYEGIIALPQGSKLGGYVAYIYYKKLFFKIKNQTSETVLNERIRIPDNQKLLLLANSYFRFQLNTL